MKVDVMAWRAYLAERGSRKYLPIASVELAVLLDIYEAAIEWRDATHTGDANCAAGDCDDCTRRPATAHLEHIIDATRKRP